MKDLAMHILDIFQNSIRADATSIGLEINEDTHQNLLKIIITDNGIGMSEEIKNHVTDPFFTTRTTRKVGLGLPLLRQNAERCGGSLDIKSQERKGTRITANFELDHIDRPVFGDIPGAIVLTSASNPSISFSYLHIKDGKKYHYLTSEVKETLGDIPIDDFRVYQYLKEMIADNLKNINVELTS